MEQKNILIVEDSKVQSEQLKKILEKNNYIVNTVYNGEQAIDYLQTNDDLPDLIISDIIMPVMNGYVLCSTLKKDEKLKNIPFILLTHLSDIKDIVQGLDSGADSFIVKPFSPSYITSRIEDILKNHHNQKESKEIDVSVYFNGLTYSLKSAPEKIVQLLLSTYENSLENNFNLAEINDSLINAQRELRQKNNELEKINNQKNQLLGTAAHDLRNPLGAIIGYSEFLLDEVSHLISDEQKEFMEIIKASSEYMLGLVNDMLDYHKIDSGNINLNLEKVDIYELVNYQVQINKHFADKKQINIIFVKSTNSTLILADKNKLKQVIDNLLTNAIKFTHAKKNIYVDIYQRDKNIYISVKDEGQGIPESEIENVFKPFSKISVRTTAGEKSTGLGLTIAKNIALAHEGDLTFESIQGTGSTFYLRLPINL